jgi:hypothetical protein
MFGNVKQLVLFSASQVCSSEPDASNNNTQPPSQPQTKQGTTAQRNRPSEFRSAFETGASGKHGHH